MVVCGTLGFPTLSLRFSSSLPWHGSTIFSALWMRRVPEADRGLEQESFTTCWASLAKQQTGSLVLARLGFLGGWGELSWNDSAVPCTEGS